jgi:SAM-dependent methyltransferase
MRLHRIEQSAHNAAIYDNRRLADWFAGLPIYPAERAVFERYRTAYVGKQVLDLAVGSGRTTPALAPHAAGYVGIDLSGKMLEVARTRHPGAKFVRMDVRDIGQLGANRFDFVLGSCAILSAFAHEERLGILGAVHDLLTPGGLFVFTAHNRNWRDAGAAPLNRHSWRPWQLLRALHPLSWIHYLRARPLRRQEADYAIMSDSAHLWRGIFYFIDCDAQTRQAEAAGFEVIEVVAEDGKSLPVGADTSRFGLLEYVCRAVKVPVDAARPSAVPAALPTGAPQK